jgi:hypothetical protein
MGIERIIGDRMWREFSEQILPSIVCIRNESFYKIPQISKLTGRPMVHLGRNLGFGTGCVFTKKGEEYLILTNHHVPYNAPVSVNAMQTPIGTLMNSGKLFKEAFHVVENAFDEDLESAVKLEFIRHKKDGDAAVMRTIGSPELPLAEFSFGAPGGVNPGEILLSTGYPHGQTRIVTNGIITSTDYWDMDIVPVPTRVYLADIKIDPGQSGSPVFVPREEGGVLKFYCIGLVYGGANDDTTRMIMPYERFSDIITGEKTVASERASLREPVTLDDVRHTFRKGNRKLTQTLSDNAYQLTTINDNRAIITGFRMENEHIVDNEKLEIELTFDPHLHVGSITYTGHGKRETLDTIAENEDLRVRYDAFFTAAINYFKVENLHNQKVGVKNIKPEQKRELLHLGRMIVEYAGDITPDLEGFYTDLRLRGITPLEF